MIFDNNIEINEIINTLKIDCSKCAGLCCVGLYFSKVDGFPVNKEAGVTCPNLCDDNSCKIHSKLQQEGLKGCLSYDCIGAGQKIVQHTFKGDNSTSPDMIKCFIIMKQLHEMLWYLIVAYDLDETKIMKEDILNLIIETNVLTYLDKKELINIDIDKHRDKVNILLRKTSDLVMNQFSNNTKNKNLIGKNLSKTNLAGVDLRGGCLIGTKLTNNNLYKTNLLACDLRDCNICGANLSDSLFLTQAQINSAIGDVNTILPKNIVRPRHWNKII